MRFCFDEFCGKAFVWLPCVFVCVYDGIFRAPVCVCTRMQENTRVRSNVPASALPPSLYPFKVQLILSYITLVDFLFGFFFFSGGGDFGHRLQFLLAGSLIASNLLLHRSQPPNWRRKLAGQIFSRFCAQINAKFLRAPPNVFSA